MAVRHRPVTLNNDVLWQSGTGQSHSTMMCCGSQAGASHTQQICRTSNRTRTNGSGTVSLPSILYMVFWRSTSHVGCLRRLTVSACPSSIIVNTLGGELRGCRPPHGVQATTWGAGNDMDMGCRPPHGVQATTWTWGAGNNMGCRQRHGHGVQTTTWTWGAGNDMDMGCRQQHAMQAATGVLNRSFLAFLHDFFVQATQGRVQQKPRHRVQRTPRHRVQQTPRHKVQRTPRHRAGHKDTSPKPAPKGRFTTNSRALPAMIACPTEL